jgi:endoglucanase
MNLRRALLAIAIAVSLTAQFSHAAQSARAGPPPVSLPQGFSPVSAARQTGQMGRGINIIGYDPIWDDFSQARFQERHFQRIREGGFRTLRVNLQAFSHMDGSNQLDVVWLSTLDWVISQALANKLTVIVDEHDFTLCAEDLAGCRPRLLAFWEQVAQRYKDTPNQVLFEILNEPNGQLTTEAWNGLLAEALAIIRKTNPTRNVVIGPAFWNSINSLKDLQLPESDRHIIVTIHYYLPMRFTHQGASWVKEFASLSGVTWGSAEDKHRVDEDFARAAAWSAQKHRPIFLGEFGAYDKGEMEYRVRYDSYVARKAESHGWAWSYWQFDSDFLAYDMANDDWVKPIHKALVP